MFEAAGPRDWFYFARTGYRSGVVNIKKKREKKV